MQIYPLPCHNTEAMTPCTSTPTNETKREVMAEARQARHLTRFHYIIHTMKRLSLLIGFLAAMLVFQGNDISLYLNAARDVLRGASPYHVPQFVNPLSVSVLFAPLSPLPDALVLRLVALVSVTIYALVILRTARLWWIGLLLMLTPIFLYNVFYSNLDWLVFAALLVSPVPAFLLAMVKPQIGLGVALIALLMVWQRNKPLALLLVALEACIFAVSFAAGMRWSDPVSHYGNFSVFPFGVVIGLPLLVLSLKRRDAVMALSAMPFLSPYVGPQSWIAVLPLMSRALSILLSRHYTRRSADWLALRVDRVPE